MLGRGWVCGASLLLALNGCGESQPRGGPSNGVSGDAGAPGVAGAPGGDGGDGGAGSPAPVNDELCGVRPGGDFYEQHVVRFENRESSDEHVVVQLQRTNMGVGVGESWLFALDAFQVSRAGESQCVTQSDRLEYENTHHNWFDVARGTAGGVTYELEMSFDEPHQLSGIAADGSLLFGPIVMIGTGSPAFCSGCLDSLPVGIGEVMVENVDTYADEAGEYDPWIELYNTSADDVSLDGWHLSDDFGDRERWPLPAVTIPRTGRILVLIADGQPEQGELHTSFALGPESTQLILTDPDGRSTGGLLLSPPGEGQSLSYSWSSGDYEPAAPTPGVAPPE